MMSGRPALLYNFENIQDQANGAARFEEELQMAEMGPAHTFCLDSGCVWRRGWCGPVQFLSTSCILAAPTAAPRTPCDTDGKRTAIFRARCQSRDGVRRSTAGH